MGQRRVPKYGTQDYIFTEIASFAVVKTRLYRGHLETEQPDVNFNAYMIHSFIYQSYNYMLTVSYVPSTMLFTRGKKLLPSGS